MDRVTWERGYHRARRKEQIAFARALRADMTPAERQLWTYLREKRFCGLKFRRQEPVGRYIADFCCHRKKLIVELDGSSHEGREEHDRDRDLFLQENGYYVLRLWNSDVLKNHGNLAFQKIRAALTQTTNIPLSSQGEGVGERTITPQFSE